jgi:hypothetical protein
MHEYIYKYKYIDIFKLVCMNLFVYGYMYIYKYMYRKLVTMNTCTLMIYIYMYVLSSVFSHLYPIKRDFFLVNHVRIYTYIMCTHMHLFNFTWTDMSKYLCYIYICYIYIPICIYACVYICILCVYSYI